MLTVTTYLCAGIAAHAPPFIHYSIARRSDSGSVAPLH
jgi:hypothetical protein